MASLHLSEQIFKLIYPVGSIYISINDTNPGTLFGGTWSRISDGFLFCGATGSGKGTQGNLQGSAKSGGPSTNTSGSTTLTIDQIPAHRHTSQNILRASWWFYVFNSYCSL